ncbi:MAG TPA: enolase C-terminal domain-like protein [Polyangiaceae bacterium]|nr:enolase C-terminal domain-like protein [Polyangiaceae bacterium]
MKLELRRVTVRTPRAQDARRSWPERESLLVRLSDQGESSGLGEASPLPGYSPDRLDQVEAALSKLEPATLAAALEQPTPLAALSALAALVSTDLPSGRMALETAGLDLLARRQGVSAPSLLGADGSSRPLAQLLGPASAPSLLPDAKAAVQAGFRHLKLKLGAQGLLAAELDGVRALRELHGPAVTLRLDANGSLSASEVTRAWQSLASLDVEWFEEPGQLPEQLLGALPLALDESLQGLDDAAVQARARQLQARCLVLKPTALGGLSRCWRLAELARTLGLQSVLSHAFDGPYAWRAAATLALALPGGSAHGLAPHAGLDAWQLAAPPVVDGSLRAWSEPGLGLPTEVTLP